MSTTATTSPGLHPSIPFERYQAIPALNYSTLKNWSVSARYAKHAEQHPPDNEGLQLGRAVHDRLFSADFEERYASLDDRDLINGILVDRPDLKNVRACKEYKAAVSAWESRNTGKTILKPDVMRQVSQVRAAVLDHAVAEPKMRSTSVLHEVTAVWEDPQFGMCKARFDSFDRKTGEILDLKTIHRRPTRYAIEREIFDRRYHMQVGWYIRAARQLGLSEAPYFTFVFAQTRDEFDVAVAHPDDTVWAQGMRDCEAAFDAMRSARDSNEYPGVSPEPIEVTMPSWAIDADDIIHDADSEVS